MQQDKKADALADRVADAAVEKKVGGQEQGDGNEQQRGQAEQVEQSAAQLGPHPAAEISDHPAGVEWKKLGSRGVKLTRLKIRKKEKNREKIPKISFFSDSSLSSELSFFLCHRQKV